MTKERAKKKAKAKVGKAEVVAEELAVVKRSQPSVEIKRDAKGNVSYTVKVYDDDPEVAVAMALDAIAELDRKFK